MKKVITYGTYDLLHQGHINLLRRAKEQGDYLIVGVTNDSFDRERGKLNVRNNVLERVEAVRATGYADGEYEFGGQQVFVKGSEARLEDGTLAGSVSTLLNCVKCAIRFGIPEADAFKMASSTPSKLIGLNKGELSVGYDADFIVVDDDYNVIRTVIDSKIQ